jgi:peptidoglycan/LPS O-acetylase OafA/YrhL
MLVPVNADDATARVDATPPGIRPQGPFWPSLDGIRGVFVLVVFAYHLSPALVPGASIAVDSFFVLSAFLITVLLVREHQRSGRISLRRFYFRRVLRLLPVMFLVVGVAAPLAYAFLPERRPDVGPSAQSVLLYYANFRAAAHPTHMAVFLPTWSLATEEDFYVAWPSLLVLLLLLLRRRPRFIVALVGLMLLAQVVWLQTAYETHRPLSALYFRPDLRITGILLGTGVGLLYAFRLLPSGDWPRRWLPWLTVAGAVYVVAFVRHPQFVPARFQATLAIVVACVAFAALVLQQVLAPLTTLSLLLANRVIRWIGRASYTIYLVHVPVLRLVTAHLAHSLAGRALVGGALTAAVTVAVHYGVERPFLRLKDRRFEPRRRRFTDSGVAEAATPTI